MKLSYTVLDGEFTRAGEASGAVKKVLKQLGIPADVIRKIAIAMYEAEINMVIHANGGVVDVEIQPDKIVAVLKDNGPGIADVEQAKQAGFSTASEAARDLGFGAGMGIPNMIKNSDFLGITTELGKGTTIEIEVKLS